MRLIRALRDCKQRSLTVSKKGPTVSNPDLPILAFFVFLAFFVLRFSLLFCAFLLSFPRISGVRQSGKSLLFSGDACFFAKKAGKGGSGKKVSPKEIWPWEYHDPGLLVLPSPSVSADSGQTPQALRIHLS